MISEEQLDRYRIDGTLLRVVRDANRDNDVRGYVVAWDESSVLIRKRSTRRLVKLDRRYVYQPIEEERALPPALVDAIGREEPGE
ncbi:hypothetical protein [Paenibacillus sp.]|uniref:hypothetical protein n=1 Tax=Paenibacillus sp. TaxID=58172 RepID=UPI002D29F7F5|nr:hypothetical protein [Paenibacillus sp.]HZG88021.1 hypothetical protein [Paenibacillus sp.]